GSDAYHFSAGAASSGAGLHVAACGTHAGSGTIRCVRRGNSNSGRHGNLLHGWNASGAVGRGIQGSAATLERAGLCFADDAVVGGHAVGGLPRAMSVSVGWAGYLAACAAVAGRNGDPAAAAHPAGGIGAAWAWPDCRFAGA